MMLRPKSISVEGTRTISGWSGEKIQMLGAAGLRVKPRQRSSIARQTLSKAGRAISMCARLVPPMSDDMTRWIAFLAVSSALLFSPGARARTGEESVLWVTDTDGTMESAWLVNVPAGSSDFFSVAHDVVTAQQTEELCASLPITAISLSVADFGSATTFPRVGVYRSNLGLDPTGNTPELSLPLVQVFNPVVTPKQMFDFVEVDTPEATIPGGTTKLHAVVQLPPNDTGQLAIGADTSSTPRGTSFMSEDGYQQPAVPFFGGNLGLNIGQDNGTSKTDGRLRVS